MGFLSRFLLKRAERELVNCLRLIRVDLFSYPRTTYSSQMNDEAARILDAQVDNFLKREDISHSLKRAETIVHEYCASLRFENSLSRSTIDAGSLPYSKNLIKPALILWLHLETDPKYRSS